MMLGSFMGTLNLQMSPYSFQRDSKNSSLRCGSANSSFRTRLGRLPRMATDGGPGMSLRVLVGPCLLAKVLIVTAHRAILDVRLMGPAALVNWKAVVILTFPKWAPPEGMVRVRSVPLKAHLIQQQVAMQN